MAQTYKMKDETDKKNEKDNDRDRKLKGMWYKRKNKNMEGKEGLRDKERCVSFMRSEAWNSVLQSGEQIVKLH